MNFPAIPTTYFEMFRFEALDSCPIPCNAHISYRLSWGGTSQTPSSITLNAYMKSFSFFSSELICGDRTCPINLQSVMCPRWLHCVSFILFHLLDTKYGHMHHCVQLILSESRLFIHLYPPIHFSVYFNEQMNRRDSLRFNWTPWCI